MFKTTSRRAITTAATLIALLAGAIAVAAANTPRTANTAVTWVKFVATQRHVDLSNDAGSSTWGGAPRLRRDARARGFHVQLVKHSSARPVTDRTGWLYRRALTHT
jgi:hypothetical protein